MNHKTLLRCAGLALLLLATPLWVHAHNGVVHGDHDAHHGGFVMMYGDLHCEVVLKPSGVVQLHLTDAMRADLPAAVISAVTVEIERKGLPPEPVRMAISAGGDYWEGRSKPVSAAGTSVRAAFVFQREPVVVNLPATAVMGGGAKPAKGKPAGAKTATKPAAVPAAGALDHHGH